MIGCGRFEQSLPFVFISIVILQLMFPCCSLIAVVEQARVMDTSLAVKAINCWVLDNPPQLHLATPILDLQAFTT